MPACTNKSNPLGVPYITLRSQSHSRSDSLFSQTTQYVIECTRHFSKSNNRIGLYFFMSALLTSWRKVVDHFCLAFMVSLAPDSGEKKEIYRYLHFAPSLDIDVQTPAIKQPALGLQSLWMYKAKRQVVILYLLWIPSIFLKTRNISVTLQVPFINCPMKYEARLSMKYYIALRIIKERQFSSRQRQIMSVHNFMDYTFKLLKQNKCVDTHKLHVRMKCPSRIADQFSF